MADPNISARDAWRAEQERQRQARLRSMSPEREAWETNTPLDQVLLRRSGRAGAAAAPVRRDEASDFMEMNNPRGSGGNIPRQTAPVAVMAPRGTVPASMGAEQDNPPPMNIRRMGDPEGTNEAAAVLQATRRARAAQAARPNTPMGSRRAASPGMSADDLNALSLARGEGEGAAAANIRRRLAEMGEGMKKGGKVKAKAPVKKMQAGGMVKSNASKRADGCAMKGKTKGRMV